MVIVMKPGTPEQEWKKIKENLEGRGYQINEIVGSGQTILGVIGDTSALDMNMLKVNECVDKVMRVQEPFKRANRSFHPEDSVIDVSGVKIGGRKLAVIAGPCSVENEKQIVGVAKSVKLAGATLLRGGAFKPRTSPYSFQGLKEEGLDLLKIARKETGLPIVTEIMSARMLERFVEDVDLIHAAAANAPAIPNTDVPIQAGDLKYKDLNGDGVINDFDKGAIGKPNLPNTTLGWTIGGSWKGLSLSLLFQGSFNYSFSVVGTGIEPFKSQFQPLHQKRWTLERYLNGEAIEFPRLTSNPSTVNSAESYMSDFWLINAWYIRLKTIDLSYQVPVKVLPSWLTNLRVYMNAYNMFTFTSYDKYQQDPEISTNSAGDAYMNQRVFNFGVQLTF